MDNHSEFLTNSDLIFGPEGNRRWPDDVNVRRREADMFDYIEMFNNPKRKHVRKGMLSPVEFELQQNTKAEGV